MSQLQTTQNELKWNSLVGCNDTVVWNIALITLYFLYENCYAGLPSNNYNCTHLFSGDIWNIAPRLFNFQITLKNLLQSGILNAKMFTQTKARLFRASIYI